MSGFACSFCGVAQQQTRILISGPAVFICSDCVQLCCEILVENKASGRLTTIGEHAPVISDLDKRVHELDFENGRMRRVLGIIGDAVRQCFPYAIKCMWCDAKLNDEAAAKEHVASCEKHPAVAALAEERSKPKRGKAKP